MTKSVHVTPLLQAHLDEFLVLINKKYRQHAERYNFTHILDELDAGTAGIRTAEPGPKYMRIIHFEQGKNRSIYCFVDVTNGDLLKGGWKAPVKNGKRGNLFEMDTWKNFNHYGPEYLR